MAPRAAAAIGGPAGGRRPAPRAVRPPAAHGVRGARVGGGARRAWRRRARGRHRPERDVGAGRGPDVCGRAGPARRSAREPVPSGRARRGAGRRRREAEGAAHAVGLEAEVGRRPACVFSPRCNRRRPKPLRAGGRGIGGPPRSTHSTRWAPSSGSARQARDTRPPGADRAPCLRALVASSCSAKARAIACAGGSTVSDPRQARRSTRAAAAPAVFGASAARATSPSAAPSQFSRVSRSWARASATSRA